MIHDVLQLEKLADMLHRANSGVPNVCRRSFYGAKEFLLRTFGTPDGLGRDIQRIDDECFGCYGAGVRSFRWGDETCLKCHGSGIYRSRLIWLDRFRFGAHVFHCPVSGVTFAPGVKPTIRGRIKHQPYVDSARCALDLALLFNRDALKAETTDCEPWSTWVPLELDGPGAAAVNRWRAERQQAEAAEWKRVCEEKVEGVPF